VKLPRGSIIVAVVVIAVFAALAALAALQMWIDRAAF
jgi:hypothetical protein